MGNFCSCQRRYRKNPSGSACYNPSLLPIIQAFTSDGVGIGGIGGGVGGCYNNNSYINGNSNFLPQVYSTIPNSVAVPSPCQPCQPFQPYQQCQPCQPNVCNTCGFSLKCGNCCSRKCSQRKHRQKCTTQCSETLNYHILHMPPQQCHSMGIGGYGFGDGSNNLLHPGYRFDNGVSGLFEPRFVDTGDAVSGSGVFLADGSTWH